MIMPFHSKLHIIIISQLAHCAKQLLCDTSNYLAKVDGHFSCSCNSALTLTHIIAHLKKSWKFKHHNYDTQYMCQSIL